jgi:tetratricopeptide (TPR) repeat protein
MTLFKYYFCGMLLFLCSAHAQTLSQEKLRQLSQQTGEYMQSGQADPMLALSRQMLILAQKVHNDSLVAESYINIGNGLTMKSDFETGLVFFLKGLHMAEEHDLTDPAFRALVNIGSFYEDIENYAEATKYIQRALVLLPRSNRKIAGGIYLNGNMGFLSCFTGKPRQALRYLALARAAEHQQTASGNEDHYNRSFLQWLEALVAEQLSPFKSADSIYRAAAAYSRQYNVIITRSQILNSYGKFLLRAGELGRTKEVALEAMRVARQAGFSADAIKASATLSKVYDRLGLTDSANYYYRLKDSLQEKVYDKQRLNRLQDMTFTEQIRQQEEAAKSEELVLQRRNNLQYAGIAVALISLIVAYLLLSRKAAKRAGLVEFLGIIGLLIFFEFINLLLHPLLGRFTHESPLLMLLLMVIIAALLVPLHHRMEGLVKQQVNKKHIEDN